MPPRSAIFSSSVSVFFFFFGGGGGGGGGGQGVVVPLVEWYCSLHGPVVPPVGVTPVW